MKTPPVAKPAVKAAGAAPLETAHVFRLYVTAGSPVSSRAVVNARRFFAEHLPGRHRLSVLELAAHVDLARADQIVASPTLIRLSPLPLRRLIGDMSNMERVRISLGLPRAGESP